MTKEKTTELFVEYHLSEQELQNNILSEMCCRKNTDNSFLDKNNILWKVVDGEWIGKKSTQNNDLKYEWIEGSETFKREKKLDIKCRYE